jgi:hypothetical protein
VTAKPIPAAGEGRADFFGQVVRVGDQVVFMLNIGGQRCTRKLVQGRVSHFTPSSVAIVHASPWQKDRLMQSFCRLEVIRVPDGCRNPALDPKVESKASSSSWCTCGVPLRRSTSLGQCAHCDKRIA